MTKFVKMSLAAAVAVTGLNASGIDYSGKLYVESYVQDVKEGTNDETSNNGHEIDFDVTAKKKINDMLTAVVGIEADTDIKENGTDDLQTQVDVDDAHFVYSNSGAAVKFGRQAINTPTTDGEVGEGILATYTMGGITVAGASFPTNALDIDGSDGAAFKKNGNGASAVAVLGAAGPVKFEAWQVSVDQAATNNTVVVSAGVAGWTLGLRNATTEYKGPISTWKDGATTILTAAGKVANVGLTAIYLTTDEDGAAFVTDASSANTIELAQMSAKGLKDAKVAGLVVSAPISDKLSATVKYATADFAQAANADDSASELVLQANYALAKATTLTVRYADYTQEINKVDTDKTHTRVDVTYKF